MPSWQLEDRTGVNWFHSKGTKLGKVVLNVEAVKNVSCSWTFSWCCVSILIKVLSEHCAMLVNVGAGLVAYPLLHQILRCSNPLAITSTHRLKGQWAITINGSSGKLHIDIRNKLACAVTEEVIMIIKWYFRNSPTPFFMVTAQAEFLLYTVIKQSQHFRKQLHIDILKWFSFIWGSASSKLLTEFLAMFK